MMTENASRTLGLEGYGLAEGGPASFVLVDAPDKWDAIRRLATTTLVVRDGEVIAQARPAEHRLMGEIVEFQREGAGRSGVGPKAPVEQGSKSGERTERG